MDSGDFSSFQMERLLKRYSLQQRLESVQKEIGEKCTAEMEELYGTDVPTNRIASDETKRFVLLTGLSNKDQSVKKPETAPGPSTSKVLKKHETMVKETFKDAWKNAAELVNLESTSEEDEPKVEVDDPTLKIARDFMFENSGLTQQQIMDVIASQKKVEQKKAQVAELSDSDSTDMQEVPEGIPHEESRAVEIVLGTDQNFGEDIFADAFTNVVPAPEKTDLEQSSTALSTNGEQSTVPDTSILSNLDEVSDDSSASEIASEETASVQKATESDKDTSAEVVENIPVAEKPSEEKTSTATEPSELEEVRSDSKTPEKSPETTPKMTTLPEGSSATKLPSNETLPEGITSEAVPSSAAAPKEPVEKPVEPIPGPSREVLLETQSQLQEEMHSLREERGKQERMAATLTEQTYLEAQQLLRLFGIPFLVAPTEAEAQCAFLDLAGMTEGTITDDSDIWLFGGRRVYKNFFTQGRHLEYFEEEIIRRTFKLDRERMAVMALLTGSDYTEGIESVGPVTALEILSEFPGTGIEPLRKFKQWWDDAQKQLNEPVETKVKKKLRALLLNPGFPNEAVIKAYMKPVVDESKEPFSWATPRLDSLREFTRNKLGWTKNKADEILLPVMRRYNQKVTQTRLDSFFKITIPSKNPKPKSKRVQLALKRVKEGSDDEEDVDSPMPSTSRSSRKPSSAKKSSATVSPKIKTVPRLHEVNFQREVDNLRMQVNKLKAIEVFRKARGAEANKHLKGAKRPRRVEQKEAKLSESSDDD